MCFSLISLFSRDYTTAGSAQWSGALWEWELSCNEFYTQRLAFLRCNFKMIKLPTTIESKFTCQCWFNADQEEVDVGRCVQMTAAGWTHRIYTLKGQSGSILARSGSGSNKGHCNNKYKLCYLVFSLDMNIKYKQHKQRLVSPPRWQSEEADRSSALLLPKLKSANASAYLELFNFASHTTANFCRFSSCNLESTLLRL